MAFLVKLQLSFMLGIHLRALELKDVATDNLVSEDTSPKISTASLKEKYGTPESPRIAAKLALPHKAQLLWGKKDVWSSQTQTLGIIPEHSNYNAKSSLSCLPDQFACDGSRCIPESFRCDLFPHCQDGSDESQSLCTPPCSNDMFVCKDGLQCIPQSRMCDGGAQCKDGSDDSEALCTPPCSVDMFRCADGLKCITKSKVCAGWQDGGNGDCYDNSNNWPSECDNCTAGQLFACADGSICLSENNVCNGDYDCQDGSDESESLCIPPCSTDMFSCADGSKCIPKSILCNGYKDIGCYDNSHNFASICDDCSADHLFKCEMLGHEVCVHDRYKCDGKYDCTDFSDEFVSGCPNCEYDPSKFTCKAKGQFVCWSNQYQCDGEVPDCDDGSDEDPSTCNNCSQPHLSMCRDGSTCFFSSRLCDGHIQCNDGSDESDEYSHCDHCTEIRAVPCPGFPGNCGKLCDGRATCPDKWDELLSTCKSNSSNADDAICGKEADLYRCRDGSMCLSNSQVCDGVKDCIDGSDEDSVACKDKCQVPANTYRCDNGSCIRLEIACSAQNQPFCEDGSDMDFSLCKGKCYYAFPYTEDPYRWPCTNGTKRCIRHTSRCDGYFDCDDGSDELNCPVVTQIRLTEALLLCLAIVTIIWIIFWALSAFSLEIDRPSQNSNVDPVHHQTVPSFLLHPALSDLDNQSWNWQEVGEQLRLEVVFFNRDPQVLFRFLYHIEAQEAHPENVHKAFKGFFEYLTSRNYDPTAVAQSMRQTIGHHRLANMALKGPPNFIDNQVFEIKKWLGQLETKGKVYYFLGCFLRAIQAGILPFLLNFDYLKDFILYLILREAVKRIEENCAQIGCLAASGTEKDILTALLITFCVSITLISIDSFLLRKRFFKTNFWLDTIFGILSPVLPAIYHFQLHQMRFKLDKEKCELHVNKDVFIRKSNRVENLLNSAQLTKEVEVGFEAIMQILMLLGLLCFYPYMFKAPSGQTYSYFFGVAHIVLKGNHVLFSASFILSFMSPCWFYVNRTDVLRHESLNMSRKLVLMARNVLFLLARVFAITTAIFIPVIKSWDLFIQNQGIDASSVLSFWGFHIEFQKDFSKGLDNLTADIRMNALFFGLLLFIHLILVASYGKLHSVNFGRGTKREQAVYFISSFCLPLPFLTIKGTDRGEEKAELWFLVALHSLENFLMVFASRLVHAQGSYPLFIVAFDCVLVLVNIMAVLVSVLYVKKLELYAGLPRDLPSSLPTYDLEVRVTCASNSCFHEPFRISFVATTIHILTRLK